MLEDDELKYKSTIDVLKKLRQVEAPKDFETIMIRRLNKSLQKKNDSFLRRLFIPSKLVPAGALIVTTLIIFFVMNISHSEVENPMLLEPRIIENAKMISVEPPMTNSKTEKKVEQPIMKEKIMEIPLPSSKDLPKDELIIQSVEISVVNKDSLKSYELSAPTSNMQPASVTNQVEIDKSMLDYKQNTINTEDKEKVQNLKQKMQNSAKKGGK
jgi:hypothetical protein